MTITYENTLDDATAWNLYRLTGIPENRRAMRQRQVIISLIYALVSTYLVADVVLKSADPLLHLCLFLPLLLATSLPAWSVSRNRGVAALQVKGLVKQGIFQRFLGPKTVTAGPEGLRATWPDGEMLYRWSAIQSVTTTDQYVALHYSAIEFTFIPFRAFASEAHRQEFLNTVERYRAASKGAAPVHGATAANTPAGSATPWYQGRYSVESEKPDVNRVSTRQTGG